MTVRGKSLFPIAHSWIPPPPPPLPPSLSRATLSHLHATSHRVHTQMLSVDTAVWQAGRKHSKRRNVTLASTEHQGGSKYVEYSTQRLIYWKSPSRLIWFTFRQDYPERLWIACIVHITPVIGVLNSFSALHNSGNRRSHTYAILCQWKPPTLVSQQHCGLNT